MDPLKASMKIKDISKKRVTIIVDEESLNMYKKSVRQITEQTETMTIATTSPFNVPERKGKHYSGTTQPCKIDAARSDSGMVGWGVPILHLRML